MAESQKEVGEKQKRKALSTSIKEGSFAGISTNIAETYITPFALALGAKALEIGFLNSLLGVLSPIGQVYGNKVMEKHSRKRIVLFFVLAQIVVWLFIAGLAYWGEKITSAVILLIVAYTLIAVFAGIMHPAWFSWMGDLVPENERGRYFSRRNRIIGIVGLGSVLIAGLILDIFETRGYVLLGFFTLFIIAAVTRFVAYLGLKKQYSPQFRLRKRDYFSFWAFLKRMDNFGKFAVYHGFVNLAIMIASPFFTVYMLEELKFSYFIFMLVSISSTIVYLLAVPFAGLFADKYGNAKLFYIANGFFILTPILWIFIKDPILLILLPQVSAGLASSAYIISSSNFVYDSVTPKHRALCISYANLLVGIGTFIGPLIGGAIIRYAHPSSISPYIFLFGVAASARAIVALMFRNSVREVRKVKRIPRMSFEIKHPWKTLNNEIHWVRQVFK